MFKKVTDILIILIFTAAISMPLIYSDKAGGKRSDTENRMLAPFPAIFTNEGGITPNINHGLRDWISDNAGFRSEARNLKALIDVRVFKTSPNSMVHIGKNGWLFYKGNENVEIGKGEYYYNEEQLKNTLTNIERIYNYITSQGIEMVFVLVPSKASVYPEYISGGNYTVQDTLIDQCADYFSANSSIPFINLKDTLIEGKAERLVYYRTDTHWNDEGEYLGYTILINSLNKLGLIKTQPVAINLAPQKRLGGLSNMLGINADIFQEPYLASTIPSPNAIQVKSGAHYEKMVRLLNDQVEASWYRYFENESAEELRALVLSDSCFVFGNASALLAEHFSSLDLMNFRMATPEIIAESNPDLIIFEITERFMFILSDPNYLSH